MPLSFIAAPFSTENQVVKREPQMHQRKKGDRWSFRRNAHIGVDAESGVTHMLDTMPANGSDVTQAHGHRCMGPSTSSTVVPATGA